jgi:AcrR family transcriptional regulator
MRAEPRAAPEAAPLTWIHRPQQDRSRKTLERLLDATEEIIRARGIDAVTIPAVVQAAQSSVGSFYARFPTKAALLSTLHERACEQSIATVEAALDPSRWRDVATADVVRTFIGFVVHLFRERRSMMLAFTTTLALEPGFAERRARTAAEIGRLFRALLLERRASIGHPFPERAVDMSLRAVTATLEQRNAFDASGVADVAVEDAMLIEELSRLVLRYLDVQAGA